MSDLVFIYDSEPAKPWFKEGSSPGYLVVRGKDWASAAKAVVIADEEGSIIIDHEEFKPCEVTYE
jgi:hypothetical protein